MKRRLTPIVLFLLLAALAAGPGPLRAQATPYVPVLDPAYQDLDALISAGLVRGVMVGERPYSRAAFERFVAEAAERLESEPGASARILEALDRLRGRFGGAAVNRGFRAASVRADAVLSNSPYRTIVGHEFSQHIDAVLDPLLQDNAGRKLDDGADLAVEGGAVFQAGHVAAEVVPRLWLGVPRGSAATHLSAELQQGYARAVFGPWSLDAGRESLALGYGLEGGAFLSDNPRGLDMVRLSQDRPIRLPGFLRGLGLWQGSASIADMGSARDIPGSAYIVMRLDSKPARYVELGINYSNLQGGTGAPPANIGKRLRDLFLFWKTGGEDLISDKVAGVDLRVAVPQAHSALWVNFFTTDDRGRFRQPAKGYWNDALWQVGARVTDLGPAGRGDLALQWVRTGPGIFTHGQFTSGQTLDGRVLGDPVGPAVAGLKLRAGWTRSASRFRLTAAWERYSGDDWRVARIPGGGTWDFNWFREADNPDEIRERVVADYLRFHGWRGLETTVRVGLEHVTRFNFTDQSRNDFLAQVTLRRVW